MIREKDDKSYIFYKTVEEISVVYIMK